jgi:hypothetical protein
MGSVFCVVDDKHVPLYRILWISDLPHFCGNDDCMCEGRYEIRLEMDESVWANREERDEVLAALEAWAGGGPESPENEDQWR